MIASFLLKKQAIINEGTNQNNGLNVKLPFKSSDNFI